MSAHNKHFPSEASFENKRWARGAQRIAYRHTTALALLETYVPSGRLLDVGCGDGTFLRMSADRLPTLQAEGIDFSSTAVDAAHSNGTGGVAVIDARDAWPFTAETFDVVVALDVLEHVLEPELVIRQMCQVSKKYVLISVPNFSSLPARLQVLHGKVPENNRPKKGHMYWFTRATLHQLLKDEGLKIVTERGNTPWARLPVLGVCMKYAQKVWPSLFSLSFTVLAEKNIQ